MFLLSVIIIVSKIFKKLKFSATCFYIGSGLFLTNKHFFNNCDINDDYYLVKNNKTTLICNKFFIPKNNMDLAIVIIRDFNSNTENFEYNLSNIKICQEKINIMDIVYTVNFSYFDKKDILKLSLPNVSVN